MRIAFIFDALLYGGIERVGISYLNFLDQEGHDVDVFVLNPKDVEGIIDEIPSRFKVYKKRVSPFMCPARYWYIAKRWWWGKILFPLVYYIVWLFIHIYGLYFKKFGKYDLAISMAGHFNDLTINGYNLIRSKKKVCWLHGALYEYMIISPAFERLYMRIKNLITLNDYGERTCLFFNKFLSFNIKKIYNPCFILERKIDDDKVAEIKTKYGDFVLMVARVSPPKNHLSLIKAMEYIYNKYGTCYNVVFLGDGELRTDMEKYVSTSPVREHIIFAGNDANPQNYYKAAKIFGFASYSEGLPTVIIEAMNFGLPIVTSDTSVREVLQNGKYGLISPIDDHASLGEDIHKVMSDDNVWTKYSKLSLERAEAFSPETIKRQFNEYLQTLW